MDARSPCRISRRLLRAALCCVLPALLLVACGGGKGGSGVTLLLQLLGADRFLVFTNQQRSLAAASYTVVAATAVAGQSGDFTAVVSFDDGSTQTFTGSWIASGGMDPASPANRRFAISLSRAGGITISLTSAVDAYVYLLDTNGNVIGEDNDSGVGTNALLFLPASKISTLDYSRAYYAAIDPGNAKDTLAKWKAANGFGAGADAAVVFRDTKDLGYGRRMFARFGGDGAGSVAIYVENYLVNPIEGLPYTTLNLDAAIAVDSDFHILTNAVEFSPGPGGGPMFVKFYSFRPVPGNPAATQRRQLVVDFDGRGPKAVPTVCTVCHGGRARPLRAGAFPDGGDTRSRLNLLEVDTFEYAAGAGYTRADLEPAFKAINLAIHGTFPAAGASAPGEWTGDLARELVEGWYGGAGFPSATYDETFVPSGWRHDPSDNVPPADAPDLYRAVVGPYCIVCHVNFGDDLGKDFNASGKGKDFDHGTYEKMQAYATQVESLVYDEARMPLALLTFQNFWDDPSRPDLLARHLAGFSHRAADGSIPPPGAPVARPGAARTTVSPARLDGGASPFAESFAWRIAATPPGAGAAFLVGAGTAQPTLVAPADGDYDVELIVSNAGGTSAPAVVTVTIDATLAPAPAALTFDADVRPILQGVCIGCHGSPGVAGVSLRFTSGPDLFADVMERVNLSDPPVSLLLRKPTGFQHWGGLQAGFDTSSPATRVDYNTILNWIMEGARES